MSYSLLSPGVTFFTNTLKSHLGPPPCLRAACLPDLPWLHVHARYNNGRKKHLKISEAHRTSPHFGHTQRATQRNQGTARTSSISIHPSIHPPTEEKQEVKRILILWRDRLIFYPYRSNNPQFQPDPPTTSSSSSSSRILGKESKGKSKHRGRGYPIRSDTIVPPPSSSLLASWLSLAGWLFSF